MASAHASSTPGAAAAAAGTRIVLLGTAGGPPPHVDRSQPAALLEVDGTDYLIDAGENAGQQLMKAGVAPSKVDTAFITHLHWDHTLGLGYVMAVGWMMGRNAPMPIWGPPGLADYVSREVSALDISEAIFRPQVPNRPPLRTLYPVHEISVDAPTVIFRDAKVRVTAVANTHYSTLPSTSRSYGVDKSYAYRFDTAAGSITFTGDTGPSPAVAALARGSNVLVSEICDIDSIRVALQKSMPGANIDALMSHMEHEHLSAAEVGKLAAQAGVKKLVLTHFVTGPSFDPAKLVAEIRRYYRNGEIVAGQDLARISLGVS